MRGHWLDSCKADASNAFRRLELTRPLILCADSGVCADGGVKIAPKPNPIAIASALFFRDNPSGAFSQSLSARPTGESKDFRDVRSLLLIMLGFQRLPKVFRLRFGETKLQPLKRKLRRQRFELDAVTTAIHGVPRKTQ